MKQAKIVDLGGAPYIYIHCIYVYCPIFAALEQVLKRTLLSAAVCPPVKDGFPELHLATRWPEFYASARLCPAVPFLNNDDISEHPTSTRGLRHDPHTHRVHGQVLLPPEKLRLAYTISCMQKQKN